VGFKASLLAGERYPAGSKLWRGVFLFVELTLISVDKDFSLTLTKMGDDMNSEVIQ